VNGGDVFRNILLTMILFTLANAAEEANYISGSDKNIIVLVGMACMLGSVLFYFTRGDDE
jgi:hypothetical protein